jgi:hypothetical protein
MFLEIVKQQYGDSAKYSRSVAVADESLQLDM